MPNNTSEGTNKLEERVRALELKHAFITGAAIALSFCNLLFLGFEWTQIPKRIDAALKDRVDAETLAEISNAKTLAEDLIKTQTLHQLWDRQGRSGFMYIGDILICFGTVSSKANAQEPWIRSFNIHFTRQFDGEPLVNISCATEGTGAVFQIYHKLNISGQECGGDLLDPNNIKNYNKLCDDVKVTYFAIGKPKNN